MNAKATGAENVIEDSYDEFPYESYVYPQTHPERLYTTAKLFGLNPPDIQKARILEIGGAGGGNVIPISIIYPKTKTVSFDLSSEQIAQANGFKKAMKLKNIEFLQRDVTKLEKDLGEFDYIICHGVFSWVPDFVRDEILAVCRRHLSKNGLAVISYNVLPGWSAIKSLREMMVYHTRPFKSPKQQIQEAKNLLTFLYENTPPSNDAYRQIIERERKFLTTTNDSYVFHEHLESENHQYYLHEFVDMASAHDLTYVGDTELAAMFIGNFNEKVRETLGVIKDVVRQEQYLDFLTNRRFRHSIITHKENIPKLNRNLNANQLTDFHIQARFRVDPQPQANGTTRYVSVTNAEAHFASTDPNSNIVFRALSEKTGPVSVEKIAAELKKIHKLDPEVTKAIIQKNGFTLLFQNFLTLHEHESPHTDEISKKPVAFAWARHQAADKDAKTVSSLKREIVVTSPLIKTLLPYLDGKNTHAQLADKLADHAANGDIKVHKENVLVTDKKELKAIMGEQLPGALAWIAKNALLEA